MELFKLNLGCGSHIMPDWDNFDTDVRASGIVRPWEWNRPLPYDDCTVGIVLVQHSLQHCEPANYDRNFLEIMRVLAPGGKFIIKEADDRRYVWHHPGSHDRDGIIASTTSEPEMKAVLLRNGFVDLCCDKTIVVNKYGEAITRARRTLKGDKFFIIEATKPVVSCTMRVE